MFGAIPRGRVIWVAGQLGPVTAMGPRTPALADIEPKEALNRVTGFLINQGIRRPTAIVQNAKECARCFRENSISGKIGQNNSKLGKDREGDDTLNGTRCLKQTCGPK